MKIMKKIPLLSIAVGIVLLFFSCNSKPEDVTNRFAQHWFKGELEAAKKYTTPESRDFINLIEGLQNQDELKKKKNTTVQIVETNTIETSDSTIICNCLIKINGKEDRVSFHLDKIDNKWLVNINR